MRGWSEKFSASTIDGNSQCLFFGNKIAHHVNLFSDRVSYCEFTLSLLRQRTNELADVGRVSDSTG